MARSTSRTTLAVSVVLSLSLASRSSRAASVPTIYDNYQMFPVGSRAAGMAGAYTALACDEGALHYNPASLACASDSHLELAANAYLIQAANVPNAVGRGQDISAVTYHSIPSIVGGVRILSEGDPDTRAGRIAFGLTVSVPRSLALKIDPPNPDQVNYISLSVRDDVTAGDLGFGFQLTRWLSIGVSAGAVLRTFEQHAQALVTRSFAVPCGPPAMPGQQQMGCTDFFFPVSDQSILAVGIRAKAGARLLVSPEVSLGLAITSPTLDVYGSSTINETDAFTLTGAQSMQNYGIWGATPTRLTGSSDVGFPLRFALGAAYSTPKVTLSADVSLNLPRDVRTAYDLKAVAIKGILPPPQSSLSEDAVHTVLRTTVQPNVNIGAEIALSDTKVIDLGAFTDFSNVNLDVPAGEDRDRLHMFGGSLAFGILGRQSRGWFGASFEMGAADTKVPSGNYNLDEVIKSGLPNDGVSTLTRWTFAGMIGSNYSFIAEKK